MDIIIQIATLLAPLFAVIAIGYVSGWLGRDKRPEQELAWLQFFLIYIALPPLLFKLMADKPFADLLHGWFILATTLATAVIYVLGLMFGFMSTPLKKGESVMQALAGSFSNVVYMGPPIVLGALGAEAAIPVALIIVFDNLFLFIITPMLMAIVGAKQQSKFHTVREVFMRVATHPFNIATALGLWASYAQFQPPQWAGTMLTSLANAAPPCALFLLGVTLALRPAKAPQREVLWLVPMKLILHPLIVWVILSLIGSFSASWVFAAMIMAALPPALNVFIFARHYETGVDRAAACVLIGNTFAIFTLTLWLALIKTGALPVDLWP